MKLKFVIYILAVVFLSACTCLSDSEIQRRMASFNLPETISSEYTVAYFISPPGYYVDYYIIKNNSFSRKVDFGRYISIKIPKGETFEFRYRYGSDFARGRQGDWVNMVSLNNADELFFIRDGDKFIPIKKKAAIKEIILIEEFYKDSVYPVYSEA
jgi:hypothetical protein